MCTTLPLYVKYFIYSNISSVICKLFKQIKIRNVHIFGQATCFIKVGLIYYFSNIYIDVYLAIFTLLIFPQDGSFFGQWFDGMCIINEQSYWKSFESIIFQVE